MRENVAKQTVMVIVAHPDDAEFMAGGTVAKWAGEGKELIYVVCTEGDKGSDDPTLRSRDVAAIRKVEQERAAEILGVRQVVFLGYEDGALTPSVHLRFDLTREIRRHRPDVIICPDPSMWYQAQQYVNHPDHRAAGEAALAAAYPAAQNRLTFEHLLAEGLEPHKVGELYLAGTNNADKWVDISDTIELKIRALRAHRSQVGGFDELADFIRQWAREDARASGRPMECAEAFKYISLEHF